MKSLNINSERRFIQVEIHSEKTFKKEFPKKDLLVFLPTLLEEYLVENDKRKKIARKIIYLKTKSFYLDL